MNETVFEASSPADYATFASLIREYVEWCRVRYSDYPWIMEMAFSNQDLEGELQVLSTSYGPPNGKTLLATRNSVTTGCIAYRRRSDTVCEMKRLFVPARSHAQGTGKRLCNTLIAQASSDGFLHMRLDTGHLFREAQNLYRSIGFTECEPYNTYPDELMKFMVFMDLALT